MGSLCDTCAVPGHCCRSIRLNGGRWPDTLALTVAEAQDIIDQSNAYEKEHGGPNGHIPFRPLYRTEAGGWVLWCPNLDLKSGRCTDYANRPAACKLYEPGCDSNCVHHVPKPPVQVLVEKEEVKC